MEHRRKGGKRIGTRSLDLTHHIDLDGTRLSDRHTDIRTGIIGSQAATHLCLGSGNREACHMHRTKFRYVDITIGRHRQLVAALCIAIDVDDKLVARSQDVVLWRGDVHHWLKGQ